MATDHDSEGLGPPKTSLYWSLQLGVGAYACDADTKETNAGGL